MAAAERTNIMEQQERFIRNLWQHQKKTELCDFTLTTNNSSIECHKVVLSSASSYFAHLLCDPEQNTNIIDVSPLPLHVLQSAVAFMYNSDYQIDDENVIELLNISSTWNLDVLSGLCVAYMNANITINNACKFYNFALENVGQNDSQLLNEFIREHFKTLHDSGKIRELSLKNYSTIIEHDDIKVENEDVIFQSAIQIIEQQTPLEDIQHCLALIRFPHTSKDFLVEVVLDHPLMKQQPQNGYAREALKYQLNSKSTLTIQPARQWQRDVYYIGTDQYLYQYDSKTANSMCRKLKNMPKWVSDNSAIALHRNHIVFVGSYNNREGDKRALLLEMGDNKNIVQLPDLPRPVYNTSVVLSDNDMYVISGFNNNGQHLRSVYHLSFGDYTWQTEQTMPYDVDGSLVIQHKHYIYVLGGYNEDGELSSVSRYSTTNGTWKRLRSMPVACSKFNEGVVIHDNKIKVITVHKCLVYNDDIDNWTVKRYESLGNRINAFIKIGQIWAVVDKSGTNSIMSFDHVENVWKTEKKIDNAWHIWLFC